jgi:hypothetical protein
MTCPRTADGVAALALHKAVRPWRSAISTAIIFGVISWAFPRRQRSVARGQRRLSGSRVQRRISSRSLSLWR